MPKIPIIKEKELLKYLLTYGCEIVRIKGSHYRLRNLKNGYFTTLPVHNKDIGRGIFTSILNDLGIDEDDFISFINK